ncbi:hypothetical protein HPB52_024377 [Rhipicephalus sanguineus]|uniref:Uncharacterized protein n=1 Tax=Rhipicephalus sanguineus TaxID=34632 RepID=A0A9D4TCD6_RHISA|nr:hypothetical protein HPB52_024377 [Rhipicephalus sanguineus]
MHQQRSDARRYRLPRCTPIPILQEEAQLNTIDELIYRRRRARDLKKSYLPKPVSRLRNPVPRPTTTLRRHIEEADATLPNDLLMVYTDASCMDSSRYVNRGARHQNLCASRLHLPKLRSHRSVLN